MRRVAIFGALALLAVCGCKKGPSFVGSWTTEVPMLGTQTVKLNEDKTADVDASKSFGQFTVKMTGKGNWSNTDKDFTITITDIKLDGLPAAAQAIADKQVEASKNKPQTGTYKWNGDDEFTLTSGTTNQDFKRVKS